LPAVERREKARRALDARPLVPLLALPLALAACRDWRERVDPARAAAEPVQEEIRGEPFTFERKGFRIRLTPRATYRITGYAVETSRFLLDEWDFVSPLDVALVWGPVADPEALRRMRFHLSRRYVSWFWEGDLPPRVRGALASHIANNHLIPAGEEVARELDRIRVGDLVTLHGRLVDIEISDASGRVVRRSPTSLSRFDTGSGACEQIWVESAEVERP
jgi:hypothetical protein